MGSENVIRWRSRTKQRMVDAFGGKCCICSYDRCIKALHFHHINPKEKRFGLTDARANPKSWDTIVEELRKCILVCNNCHSEIHAGIVSIPEDASRFDETYATYKHEHFSSTDKCPVCGEEKPKKQKTCSYECAAKRKGKIDWDSIDLEGMKTQGMSNVNIAEQLGCSEAAVRKRLIKGYT